MAGRILQERSAQLKAAAAALGATATDTDRRNLWDIAIGGKAAGQIRHELRAKLWLSTTGKESTIGDMLGCLQFVIRRN